MVKKMILLAVLGAFASPSDCQANWMQRTAGPMPVACPTAASMVKARIVAGRELASRAHLNRRRSNLDAQWQWLSRQMGHYNASVENYYFRYYRADPVISLPILQEPIGPYLPPPPSGAPESWESATEERSVLVH